LVPKTPFTQPDTASAVSHLLSMLVHESIEDADGQVPFAIAVFSLVG
jgi:hypothetical protein